MFHPTLSKSGRFFFAPLIKFCEFLGNHYPELLLKLRYRYVFSKKGIRNSQSNMQTTSISPQNRTKIQSLQN